MRPINPVLLRGLALLSVLEGLVAFGFTVGVSSDAESARVLGLLYACLGLVLSVLIVGSQTFLNVVNIITSPTLWR